MANFRDRLIELFEEAKDRDHKMTRAAFAKMIGVTIGQFNGWIDKESQPGIETLMDIAKCANVSVSWLIGETDSRYLKVQEHELCISAEAREEFIYMVDYLKYKYDKKRKQKEDVAE